MGRSRIRRRGPLLAALLAAGMLAGCTSDPPQPPPTPDPSPVRDDRLAHLVPEAIRADGTLLVGTDPSYPPMSFTTPNGADVQGVDVDLISGIATVLGLTPTFQEEAFTALPVAVRTGRVEVGISALTVRRRTLTDAVLYYRSGSQLVASDNAPELTPDTMCGLAIAVLEGSFQVVQLKAASRDCVAQGAGAISIEARSDQDQVTKAALSPLVAGMLTDTPVARYAVQQHPGRLALAGAPFAPAPLGILTAPELPRFARAVRGALQQLIDSGYYDQVLRTWGVPQGAVRTAKIQWSIRHERKQRADQRRQ